MDVSGGHGHVRITRHRRGSREAPAAVVALDEVDHPRQARGGRHERIELDLRDAADNRLKAGASQDGNSCPTLSRDDLSEGRYYLKLTDTLETGLSEILGYRLRVELSPP